eukprot:7390871-Prymnesium_polylepis.2
MQTRSSAYSQPWIPSTFSPYSERGGQSTAIPGTTLTLSTRATHEHSGLPTTSLIRSMACSAISAEPSSHSTSADTDPASETEYVRWMGSSEAREIR